MKIRLITPIVFFILLACNFQEPDQGLSSNYFNMDSLVSKQVKELMLWDPELEKDGTLDEHQEKVMIHLDSLGWENELKVFRDTNIDKPAFIGYYSVHTGLDDPFSNLLYDEYDVIISEQLPVRNLKIYYLDVRDAIKKIEVVLKDKNELFESERHLTMNFDNRQGIPLLSSYRVRGSQKLKLNDSVRYEMNSKLIF